MNDVQAIAALSAVVGAVLAYFGALIQFKSRIDAHETSVRTRIEGVERMVRRLDRRSLASLRILVDIANKEGVLNRVGDQLGDLLSDEDEE